MTVEASKQKIEKIVICVIGRLSLVVINYNIQQL